MGFVKLDCGILTSTLWPNRSQREVFLTALLMAEPFETQEEMPQIEANSLNYTGFIVPPGWYGFVRAAGVGILRVACVDYDDGMKALIELGSPDPESRSAEFDGRRLVRVNGGFIVLNFMKYREKDHTTAERARRYREKKKNENKIPSRRDVTASRRDITQAEAEAYKKIPIQERNCTKKTYVGTNTGDDPEFENPFEVVA